MAKMLKVYDCSECPHYGSIIEDGVNYAYCQSALHKYGAEDTEQVPAWCPLPDAPEE